MTLCAYSSTKMGGTGAYPVLVHALMAVKTGDDYIGTAAGVTDAFNQSCFILFVHKCFYFCFFAFLDGKEAFHSGTELDMVLIRQCPGLYPADFHHAVISAKCLVDLPDLFEFLLRKDVGAAPTQGRKSRSGYRIGSGVAGQRPLGPGGVGGYYANATIYGIQEAGATASSRFLPMPQGWIFLASAASIVPRQPCQP